MSIVLIMNVILHVFIILLSSTIIVSAVPTAQNQLPLFQTGTCDYSGSSIRYNAYTNPLDIQNINFDGGWNITTFEQCDPANDVKNCLVDYQMEARRDYMDGLIRRCQTCPYHWDKFWMGDTPPSSSDKNRFNNLYGPCFNGWPSIQTVCSQHPALAPKGFVGVYHFPIQMPFTQKIWNQSMYYPPDIPLPMHTYFTNGASSEAYESTANTVAKDPSKYGLGKAAVQAWLKTVQLINKTTGKINEPLTADFLRPYSTINGVEQWLKWAQFFCFPGCHRDSRYTKVIVRPSDITNKPENYYLTSYLNADNIGDGITRCTKCPTHFAAYDWDISNDAPYHPKVNILASQCYPWFGSIPSILLDPDSGYQLNITYINHTNWFLDGIYSPETEEVVGEIICPVNTYNRECAHAKRYYYANNKMAQYSCTPCPSGYHTAGLTGQWYCRPLPGKIFTFAPFIKDPTNIWANRDLLNNQVQNLGFPELECGYKLAHCLQQPECNTPTPLLPNAFNEMYIFSKLLQDRPCAIGSYCPDPFTEILCPTERPWSPPNSFSLANCSCYKGTYLSNLICKPCTSTCTISGTYLPTSQCMEKNGASQDAPCIPCTNLPSSNAISTGIGFEFATSIGICPFTCTSGSILTRLSSSSITTCQSVYSCKPLTQIPKNSNGQYIYYAESSILPVDAFDIKPADHECIKLPGLTYALDDPTLWKPQLDSCYQRCSSTAQTLCYADIYPSSPFLETPWYSLTGSLQCKLCPNLKALPSSVYLSPYIALEQKAACELLPLIQCADPTFYFNKTAWECQSCKLREQLVCPNNTRLRGQGCLGVLTSSFNLTNPTADCQQCNLNMPDPKIHGQTYLNYNNGASETGGCAIEQCALLPISNFWAIPCGGDQPGKQSACSIGDCPTKKFQASPCTNESDRICTDCTTFKQGYFLLVTCGLNVDSQWQLCPKGFYCTGNGSKMTCPPMRTSQPGAISALDCYCNVGMRESSTPGQCVLMQCPNTIQDPNLPGPSLVSTQYMTLNPQTRSSTICLPCGDAEAVTQGSGLEITSCTCPPGKYAIRNSTNPSQIQCLSCASIQSTSNNCTDKRELPLPCSRTLVSSKCKCAIPPYSALLPIQNISGTLCAATCQPNYISSTYIVERIPLQGWPTISGSMLYISKDTNQQEPTWIPLLTSTGPITAFATTSELDDSALGNAYHQEYVFWTTQNSPFVFSQYFPDFANNGDSQWQVFGSTLDSNGNQYTITHLAVSKWDSASSSVVIARTQNIYVAALTLISNSQQNTLALSFNQFKQGAFVIGSAFNNNTITLFSSVKSIQVVAFLHWSTALGNGNPQSGGFFYTAFNLGSTCGGLLLFNPITLTVSPSKNPLCGPSTPPILGFTVCKTVDRTYPTAYVLLASSGLYKLDLIQGTILSTASPLINIGNGFLTSISPQILLLHNKEDNTLITADTSQWTWNNITALPIGTAPSLPYITTTGLTPTTGFLVAAYGSNLYRINTAQCTLGSYWNGVACVQHSCQRIQQCGVGLELINSQCVCIAGFYQAPPGSTTECLPCNKGFYCNNGQSIQCPTTRTTLFTKSTSINDCICSTTGSYYSPASAVCMTCTPNSWCPDSWSVFKCPGTSAPSTLTGQQFPVTCSCPAGFTGPACVPCPSNFYCPTTTTSTVYNVAIIYTNITYALAMPVITQTLVTYFNTPGTRLTSISTVRDLDSILYVSDIQATNSTPQPSLMVMLQLPTVQQSWGTALLSILLASGFKGVTTVPVTGTPVFQSGIPNNVPTQCLTGKVPSSPIASTCICAPGYESNGQQCKACAANTFKEEAGADTSCIPCPVGLVSIAASASCSKPLASSTNDNANGGPNTTLLIGAVVGGVLGLLLLLFIFQFFFLPSSRGA